MTTTDLRIDTPPHQVSLGTVAPARQLAAALLHVLDRDDPLPPRWRAHAFVSAVAVQRASLAWCHTTAELDSRATGAAGASFRGAVTALASDPSAVALAVRRLELLRGASLPAWPVIVRHGVGPRVTHVEQGRWFG